MVLTHMCGSDNGDSNSLDVVSFQLICLMFSVFERVCSQRIYQTLLPGGFGEKLVDVSNKSRPSIESY